MAYYLVTVIKNFIGESFDTKPTTGVPPGSTFFETDTKNRSIYTGAAWAYKHGSLVYAIRGIQSIGIMEVEEDYETAYIVAGPSQALAFAEAHSVVLILRSDALDTLLVSEENVFRLDDNVSGSDGSVITEVGEIAVTE